MSFARIQARPIREVVRRLPLVTKALDAKNYIASIRTFSHVAPPVFLFAFRKPEPLGDEVLVIYAVRRDTAGHERPHVRQGIIQFI